MTRPIAFILVLDGLITLVWGHGFLRWQRRFAAEWHKAVLDEFLDWSEPALRLGAALQAVFGALILVLRRA